MSSVIFHNFDRKLTVEEIEDEIFHRKKVEMKDEQEVEDEQQDDEQHEVDSQLLGKQASQEDELLGGLYTDNPYEFVLTNEEHEQTDNVISSNKINFMKHQIIPK